MVDPLYQLSDDFFVNMNLNTEMSLPTSRETILNFFERVQKAYPTMRNFYTRENGDFVLEEDKDGNTYRWLSLESKRICSGYVNPPDVDTAFSQHKLVLELVPYMLSVSPLDCEALDFLVGFDFLYKGNHDEIVAEALGMSPMVEAMLSIPHATILNYEPQVTISLEEGCRKQARMVVETRTNANQVRRREFNEDPISVYFTVRQYGSLALEGSYIQTLSELRAHSERLLSSHIAQQVLRPLAVAIEAR
jgi:hypothetical protein